MSLLTSITIGGLDDANRSLGRSLKDLKNTGTRVTSLILAECRAGQGSHIVFSIAKKSSIQNFYCRYIHMKKNHKISHVTVLTQ